MTVFNGTMLYGRFSRLATDDGDQGMQARRLASRLAHEQETDATIVRRSPGSAIRAGRTSRPGTSSDAVDPKSPEPAKPRASGRRRGRGDRR